VMVNFGANASKLSQFEPSQAAEYFPNFN